MSDLDISNNIFTENGSRNFKNRIAQKKIAIPNYIPAELINQKQALEYRKYRMTERLGEELFSPAQKTTYEIYLKDVEDLINAIDARLRLLELAGGTRKGRKSRRRRSYKRKGYKRKSYKRKSRRNRK